MTIRRIADIKLLTHAVQVSRDTVTDRIYLFKHTDRVCDYAQFDTEAEAAEYIITPFPNISYRVEVHGDDPAEFA